MFVCIHIKPYIKSIIYNLISWLSHNGFVATHALGHMIYVIYTEHPHYI